MNTICETDFFFKDVKTIEEFQDLVADNCNYDVVLRHPSKNIKFIQVNSENPEKARREFAKKILPSLGISDFEVPRFTKKTRFQIIVKCNETEFRIVFKKGGDYRSGRANELGLQNFIKRRIAENGICHLDIKDKYGVELNLDIVEVIDNAANHGTDGERNRSDTSVVLSDGTLFGISQKKKNASYVCAVKTMLKEILFRCEQELRRYAKSHSLRSGDYISVRITNKDLLKLCWFGTDIAQGAAIIGDFENLDSETVEVERIIKQGDDEILESFPLYMKWRIENTHYTMKICGVVVSDNNGKWSVEGVELGGINAPMPIGKSFRAKIVNEAHRERDLWDVIADAASKRKCVWLKYETEEEKNIISRKVAPYSYRTKFTKNGKCEYFYAYDYTPGQKHTIKSFKMENCLAARPSALKFRPRWTVEIKQEIDRQEDEKEVKKLKNKEKRKLKSAKADVKVSSRPRKIEKVKPTPPDEEEQIKKPLPPKPVIAKAKPSNVPK